ncbi:MAG: ABC transporter permease subunit [Candidatus Bathyarchaeia archaeon]
MFKKILACYLIIISTFVLFPTIAIVISSFTATMFPQFPPSKWSLWGYKELLKDRRLIIAMQTSGALAALVASSATLIGCVSAYQLARRSFRGKTILQTIILAPLSTPMVVLALALLLFFSNLKLTRTFTGLFLSHLLITIPYAVRCCLSNLQGLDPTVEKAAWALGGNPVRVAFTITVPQMKAGLLAAFLYSFILSFENVTFVLFIGGGRIITFPYEIFYRLEYGPSTIINASASFVIITFAVVFIIADWLGKFTHVIIRR